MSTTHSRDNGRTSGIDDGGSVVSEQPRRQLRTGQKIGVAGLLAVVLVGFIWIEQLNKKTQEAKQPDVPLSTGGAFRPAPALIAAPAALPMPLPATLPTPAPLAASHEMTAAESPIFAYAGGGGSTHEATLAPVPTPASATSGASGNPAGQENALSSRLKPTMLSGSKARLLPHPDMMVTEGTIIPCTLQTAIDSQLAGFVKCVLPQSVRSTTGNVVLLDRGTIVVGEIQAGLVQGQNRVFVLWDRAG